MNAAIVNAQKIVKLSQSALRDMITWFVNHIPEFDPDEWNEISLVITDDEGIAAINEECLKHRGPTDVITFTFQPMPGETGKRGEIYVNVQRAVFEAKKRRIEPSRELAFYIAHGFDHLCGFEDRTPAMRARMHKREQAWLRAASAEFGF